MDLIVDWLDCQWLSTASKQNARVLTPRGLRRIEHAMKVINTKVTGED
jgi:hypothetical protein